MKKYQKIQIDLPLELLEELDSQIGYLKENRTQIIEKAIKSYLKNMKREEIFKKLQYNFGQIDETDEYI